MVNQIFLHDTLRSNQDEDQPYNDYNKKTLLVLNFLNHRVELADIDDSHYDICDCHYLWSQQAIGVSHVVVEHCSLELVIQRLLDGL